MQASNAIEQLRNLFAQQANIELALLIGSRALGQAREESDWDFAVQWRRDIPLGEEPFFVKNMARSRRFLLGERPCGLTSISRKRRNSRVTKQKF